MAPHEGVIKLEPFEGQRDKVRLWFEDFEAAAMANGWSSLMIKKYFSTFLHKTARDWFTAIAQPKMNERTPWFELRSHFIRFLIGPEEQSAIKEEIKRCRQASSSPVASGYLT